MSKTINKHKNFYKGNSYIFCVMNRMFQASYVTDREAIIKAQGSVEQAEKAMDIYVQHLCSSSTTLLNGSYHKPRTTEAIRLLARKC